MIYRGKRKKGMSWVIKHFHFGQTTSFLPPWPKTNAELVPTCWDQGAGFLVGLDGEGATVDLRHQTSDG